MKNAIIIGDSYSTYAGHIPEGYPTYYPSADVDSVDKTWWAKLGNQADLQFVQNNSWSGSPLGFTGYNGTNCSRFGSFIARYRELKAKGFFDDNKIDTVFVFGGTNDSWADAPLGELQLSDWVDEDLFNVLPAICYLTYILKTDLPNAEIVLIINTDIKDEIRDCFEVAAKQYGVNSVRLHDIDKVNNHPSAAGMAAICHQVAAVLQGA